MCLRILLILSVLGCADCLMCYQCADSSSDEDKNQCQTYIRTMRKYKRLFLENGNLGKYVKNCSGFGDLAEEDTYCHITSVESRGNALSYIRDCGNGKDFFGDPFDVMFQNGNVISNNKSTCLYNPQGYLVCVTICGPNQDFCNGPESSATHNTISTPIVLALGLLCLIPYLSGYKTDFFVLLE